MNIVGYVLYVCLSYSQGGLQCHKADIAQMSYISAKEVCEHAVEIIESDTSWHAYCLPVTREK